MKHCLFAIIIAMLLGLTLKGQTSPLLIKPTANQTSVYLDQTFEWSTVNNATYKLQVTTVPGFSWNQIDVNNITQNKYKVSGLYQNTAYHWRVIATVNGVQYISSTGNFTTGNATEPAFVLNPPTLVAPINNKLNEFINPTFSWEAVTDAETYQLQVSTSNGFWWNQVDIQNITNTNITLQNNLFMNTQYYWRVASVKSNVKSFSEIRTFTTGQAVASLPNPNTPVLLQPENNAQSVTTTNTFYWQAVAGKVYKLEISVYQNFQVKDYEINNIYTGNYQITGLAYATNYYWRVGLVENGNVYYSQPFSFTTGLPGDQTGNPGPQLITPLNDELNYPNNGALFKWQAIEGAVYNLQISASEYFGVLNKNITNITEAEYIVNDLFLATTFYWRVNATVNNVTSDWSAYRKFTTWLTPTDSGSPTVQLIAPQNNSLDLVTPVEFTWSSNNNPEYYQIQISETNAFVNFVVDQNNLTESSFSANNLSENKEYHWRVRAYKNGTAGNWSSVYKFNAKAQVLQPELIELSIQDNYFTNNNNYNFNGRVNNWTNSLYINGNLVNFDANGYFSFNLTLIENDNNIKLLLKNANGDSVVVNKLIVLDTTLPEIIINNPVDGLITNQASINLDALINELNLKFIIIGSDTVESINKNISLTEGKNNIKITIIDKAGNIAIKNILVIKDTLLPLLVISSPPVDFETLNETIKIEGFVKDSTNVELKINNNLVNITANGNFSHNQMLIDGVNLINVEAKDQAGNITNQSFNVIKTDLALPPDPKTIATKIDSTIITPFAETISFLYESATPVQYVEDKTIFEEERVTVLRGKVLNMNGEPLPGVKVTIFDNPQYGYTLSRRDGEYDLVVNGGGTLTLNYDKAGYIGAQRNIVTEWNGYGVLDELILVRKSTVKHNYMLSDSIKIKKFETSIDKDGPRTPAILIKENTTARMKLKDGTYRDIDSLTISVTEFTVGENGPKAMPAILPPNSAYTYCSEILVDQAEELGAVTVEFSKPVVYYLDNFLGLPAGVPVPLGYYNREIAAWQPDKNGLVIDVIAIENNIAVLDLKGNGQAATERELEVLGINNAELIEIAKQYPVGASLWRVDLPHFSLIDLNFPYRREDNPPPPPPPKEDIKNSSDDKKNQNDKDCGSIIGVDNQSLGEVINIAGSEHSLYYNSLESNDYFTVLDIPVTDYTPLDTNIKRIELKISIAGRSFLKSFIPTENINYKFIWDKKDGYDRKLKGTVSAKIEVDYYYNSRIATLRIERQFALNGWELLENIRMPFKFFTRTKEIFVDADDQATSYTGIGNWSFDYHHIYDQSKNIIIKGDKSRFKPENLPSVLNSYANFTFYDFINDISFDNNNYMYYNYNDKKIIKFIKIPNFSNFQTIAGNGTDPNNIGDGGSAVNAYFDYISDFCFDLDGNVLIADRDANRIRKIEKNGIINTIAGNGESELFGNGIKAVDSKIKWVTAIAVGPDKSIYFSDLNIPEDWSIMPGAVIRKISPDGYIHTIAGTGKSVYNGDKKNALETNLTEITDIKVDKSGEIYFIDSKNERIRKITNEGFVITVAGIGETDGIEVGVSAPNKENDVLSKHMQNKNEESNQFDVLDDGELATSKAINPENLVIKKDGTILFTENYNDYETGQNGTRVRYINKYGNLYTLAGGGELPSSTPNIALNQIHFGYYDISSLELGINDEIFLKLRDGKIYKINLPQNEKLKSVNTIEVPDNSENLTYVFDKYGRHLRTINNLTNKIVYKFNYDSNFRLSGITDENNLTTTITRDASGKPLYITAPFGQKTFLGLDENGYLSKVKYESGDSLSFNYTKGGLLTKMIDKRNFEYNYYYDAEGKLIKDVDPLGGFLSLHPSKIENGYKVETRNNKGFKRSISLEAFEKYSQITTRQADGSFTRKVIEPSKGLTTIFNSDGTRLRTLQKPDPQFGMNRPLIANQTITSPAGLSMSMSQGKFIQKVIGDRLGRVIDTLTINGNSIISDMDLVNNKITTISPENRMAVSFIDSLGRVTESQIAGILPVKTEYNNFGFIKNITQGTRKTSFSYDERGRLASVTNPSGKTEYYQYDIADRITRQVLTNGKAIEYSYDANGNLLSLTPPGKAPHRFNYTAVNLADIYLPPVTEDSAGSTSYYYNILKQLTHIRRADNNFIVFEYDSLNCGCASDGKVKSILFDRGRLSYEYKPQSGALSSVLTPENNVLLYSYDGSLPTKTEWLGAISGKVEYVYNNDFRISQLKVNDTHSINYTYDKDGLLKQSGMMQFSYNNQNGNLIGTSIGNISDSFEYTNYGEISSYTAKYNNSEIYKNIYAQDSLGRIKSRVETIQGKTTSYNYLYDTYGYLTEVKRNDTIQAKYTYDANGNRIFSERGIEQDSASYDAQDRMLSYGLNKYIYSKNGEMQAKITGNDTTYYNYDHLGNLIKVNLPNGKEIEYVIDGQNRRIGKKENGRIVKRWLYQD